MKAALAVPPRSCCSRIAGRADQRGPDHAGLDRTAIARGKAYEAAGVDALFFVIGIKSRAELDAPSRRQRHHAAHQWAAMTGELSP